MNYSQQLFRQVKATVGKFLEASGFTEKNRKMFTKESADVIHLFQLQKSDRSTALAVVLTLNVGIICKPLAAKMGDESEKMDVWDCHWRKRIGWLMPCSDDYWWKVSDPQDAEKVGKEIVEAIRCCAFPVLNELCSTEKLVALWKSGQSPGLTDSQRLEYLRFLEVAK
jgi:hypothetical protein